MVRCINTNRTFGTPTEEGYYHKLAAAFHMLVQKVNEMDCKFCKSEIHFKLPHHSMCKTSSFESLKVSLLAPEVEKPG